MTGRCPIQMRKLLLLAENVISSLLSSNVATKCPFLFPPGQCPRFLNFSQISIVCIGLSTPPSKTPPRVLNPEYIWGYRLLVLL